MPLADGAAVLEIGCAEADWLGYFAQLRPDVRLTGIDWRPTTLGIRGDVLSYDFPAESFDAVVSISAIEHIGLGAYDHDPVDPDGDTHAVERAWGWLKPGARLYFDVPYRPVGPYSVNTNFRAYDPEAFRHRLVDPIVRASPQTLERWRAEFSACGGDAPYLAVVWEKPKG